eukprot:CAMPEP_0178896406 /NCGR_PEP_ID=MMETSP0786-20121207/1154_1 /TAXON_ID=186022 /ORGANISM="Thalassionema frauenfeldii, Strain CCMP 1798" /LENGTH=331 /DNA_ID=CAMNT_0020566803 /DNA_START=218 /DNA_END=1214 /DNA_ORIENTATION=-
MTMKNNIKTTVLHQAITSKGDLKVRAIIMKTILENAPEAAKIGMDTDLYHSMSFVNVTPKALTQTGGVGGRTPIHIAFTDYISPDLARDMIERGKAATFMKDKNGWLPIHVAVSRHCSPRKLSMLLNANPESLHARTGDGKTILALAEKKATKSHPNFALISEIKQQFDSSTRVKEESLNDNAGCDMHHYAIQTTGKPKAEAAELLLNFSKQTSPDNVDNFEHYPRHQVVTPPKIPAPVPFYPSLPPPHVLHHPVHHHPGYYGPPYASHHVPHHPPRRDPHYEPHYEPHHGPHHEPHHEPHREPHRELHHFYHNRHKNNLTREDFGEVAQV